MRNLIFILVSIGIMISCKNTDKKQANETTNPKLLEYTEQVKGVFEKPSKPSQITGLLELSGVPLMPELINDPENWEKYSGDDLISAANMGIYLADAIIQYSYDSLKLAYNSAIAAKQLANTIGISEDVFMGHVIKGKYAEVGMENDSIFFVLDSALVRAEKSLDDDERFRLLAAMFVGNYIEKHFIVSNIIFNYPIDLPEENKLLILRQMMLIMSGSLNRLDYIIELVEKASTEKEIGYLLGELKLLKKMHIENKFTEDELLNLKPADIFENKGLLGMHKQVVKIRNFMISEP